LCLQGNGHATPEDHVDLAHLIFIVGIGSTIFAPTWLLCNRCWWWHLITILKFFALFQIMSCGMIDFTPLFYVDKAMEHSFILLNCGLLQAIPVISVIPAISTIGCVDHLIVLFFL
jgi:hypothetical protein